MATAVCGPHLHLWFCKYYSNMYPYIRSFKTSFNRLTPCDSHTYRKTEHSMIFATIRQSKKFIVEELIKKCCGWECNVVKWLGTRWKTHNWVNLLSRRSTVNFHWVTSDNMFVGNHQICYLLIMLRQFKIIFCGWTSFSVICSEGWKCFGRCKY
jgi:hypothetical protein